MTDIVEITTGNVSDGYQLAKSIQNAGGTNGWVVPTFESTLSTKNSSLNAAVGEFEHTTTSGLDVTFDTGEAYVGGTWLARDVTTTVTLTDNTSGTVYVGWDSGTPDTVIIGEASAFGTYDPKIELYDFTTASGAVSTLTDQRTIGQTISRDKYIATDIGSEFDVLGFTGASADPVAALDTADGEIWRGYGISNGDLAATVENGSDRFAFTYNANLESGVWRNETAGDTTYAIRGLADNSGIGLFHDTTSPSDGSTIVWKSLLFNDGDVNVDGTTLYDGSAGEVPKAQLGGPASSLSSYPIPSGDIDGGTGSGLDADTVRGQTPGEISGQWTEIATKNDTSSPLEFDSGLLGPKYDRYRLEIYREAATQGEDYMNIRVNGISTSSYWYDFYDGFNNTFGSNNSATSWGKIAGVESNMTTGGDPSGQKAMQVVEIACPESIGGAEVERQYPTISTTTKGVGKNVDYVVQGTLTEDINNKIERLELFGDNGDSRGRIRLLGRDVL